MIQDFKICPKCGINKKSEDYHFRTINGKKYLKSYCKICSNKNRKHNLCSCGSVKQSRSKTCQSCQTNKLKKYQTLGDVLESKSRHQYNIIRSRARSQNNGITSCEKCGYSKHVECCHIKPIHTFDLDTPIDVINDKSNLLFLCPNCHWEFDNKNKLPR